MAQNTETFCQYINSEIFDDIPYDCITVTRDESTGSNTRQYRERKFIIDAPIGCGKSSAVCKWISKTVLNQKDNIECSADSKFILIVPTINIASEFYNKIYNDFIHLNHTAENKYLTLCIKDGAFDEFKQAFTKNVRIIITTYSTASRCLGSLVEHSYHSQNELGSDNNNIDLDNYTLIFDEAHFLLNYIPLIEIIRDFNNVGLLSATIDDIAGLSVFKNYRIIKPEIKTQYNRNIIIHQLGNKYQQEFDTLGPLSEVSTAKLGPTRYEYILNQMRANTWNNMTIESWCNFLQKLGKVSVTVKIHMENLAKPKDTLKQATIASVEGNVKNNKVAVENSSKFSGKQINKEFNGLKKLYKYYGFKKPPANYKIIMTKRLVDDKRVRMYKLIEIEQQQIEQEIEQQQIEQPVNESDLIDQFGSTQLCCDNETAKPILDKKELNKIFKGKKELYKYYDINECPQGYIIQTKTLNEGGKRIRAYWLSKLL